MSIKKEILKNRIRLSSLEDESLVMLFRELEFNRENDRVILNEVVKILALRKKLYLITTRW
jgi:hypothetical protein